MEKERDRLNNLLRGDHQAFETLYHQYKTPLVRHLLYLFKSEELAEELAQDTFVTVWQERQKVDPEQSFRAYLYTIATNKAYNLFRRASYDAILRDKLRPFQDQPNNLVEDYITRRENRELMEELLQQMPPRQREVFVLAKIEGHSYREISEQLNISANTINTHLKRANQFLKEKITNRQEWLGALLITISDIF